MAISYNFQNTIQLLITSHFITFLKVQDETFYHISKLYTAKMFGQHIKTFHEQLWHLLENTKSV